jgi:hypothetical protein
LRHCERSEAIYPSAQRKSVDCFVAIAPRNDVKGDGWFVARMSEGDVRVQFPDSSGLHLQHPSTIGLSLKFCIVSSCNIVRSSGLNLLVLPKRDSSVCSIRIHLHHRIKILCQQKHCDQHTQSTLDWFALRCFRRQNDRLHKAGLTSCKDRWPFVAPHLALGKQPARAKATWGCNSFREWAPGIAPLIRALAPPPRAANRLDRRRLKKFRSDRDDRRSPG